MSRTYAAVSNKGGAGKTTLVTLLAGEYALRGERVLLIDADNRQNLSGWELRYQPASISKPVRPWMVR
jgi:chromosome partitioning protein